MANAIVGTLVLIGLACAVGCRRYPGGRLPCGVRTRPLRVVRSLRRRCAHGRAVDRRWHLRLHADGAPDARLLAYAGGCALAVIMLPIVTRTTEEMLHLVRPRCGRRRSPSACLPGGPRCGSCCAPPGAASSRRHAPVARVAGETAPLLFTAFGNQFWQRSLNGPISSLPVQLYTYAISPFDDWHRQAWLGRWS